MGACSSKEKKSTSNGSTRKVGKPKPAKKGRKGQGQKSKNGGQAENCGRKPSLRKDSDVEDFQVPPQRGRSKSLRFGDFAQMDRVRKVGDGELLPIDIAFFQDGKVEPEELCHVCSVYTGSETLLCGVCYRVFHEGCLAKIGQWSGPTDTGLGGMWSCHQCANLGNMLTEEEIINVLKRLDKCGIRREDDLTMADYLAFCHLSLQEDEGKVLTREKADNARRRFQQADDSKRGRITWLQFLNIESVRILKKRHKNALVRLLTAPELERARDAFRTLDTDKDGRITKAMAHDALDRDSRRSGYYPDETMMYIDEDLDETISWTEFLRDRAIYIIAERPALRASPLDVSTAKRRGSGRSTASHVTSLQVDPDVVLPTATRNTPSRSASSHAALSRQASGDRTRSGGGLPVARTPSGGGHSSAAARGSGNKSGPTTPVSKTSQGFPILPPPPTHCSRAGSHRRATSVPSTPEKKFPPEMFGLSGAAPATQQHEQGAGGPRSSTHSTGSGGGGSQRQSGSSEGSWNTAQSGRSSVNDSSTSARRQEVAWRPSHGDNSSSSASPAHHIPHVTGKPPMGNSADGRHARTVVAPPYGKLVERLQSGEWRKAQTRSMVLPSDSLQLQLQPTFGNVTGDVNTGRRPLSLV